MTSAKVEHFQPARLGDLLIEEGLITDAQLAKALGEQQKSANEKLGSILVRLKFVNEDQLIKFLARQYRVPSVTLSKITIEPDVLKLIPAQVAQKYEVLPVKRAGDVLTLAMADPSNEFAINAVVQATKLQVSQVVAFQAAIQQAIARYYGAQPASGNMMSKLSNVPEMEVVEGDEEDESSSVNVFDLTQSAEEAPVVKLVNLVLSEAIEKGASDIHWEPYQKVFRIRFRIDGVLHEMITPPKRLEPAILSRIKIMSNLNIAERRRPQDGRIKLRLVGREIDFRVSTLPTIFGEKAVLRILDKDALKLDLSALGFDPWSMERFTAAIHQPYGMILITGPTGSGKTTTLYSAIHTINSPEVNIMTAEDPVEYNLAGVNQVQINDQVGRTFAATLRSFLRQDPDIILVGETRDLETAQIGIRAALTGHLVLTTLHTNDCPSTVARLMDMGVPPFLLASSLLLILAQRLGRRVCKECREPFEIDEEQLTALGHTPTGAGKITIYNGKGCSTCNFTGLKGRVAIYEVMAITEELRHLIIRNAPTGEIRALAQAQGMKTLRQAGLVKVTEGVTTIDEVLRVTLT
jgi:type IV pilus assembly protein PilB